MKELLIGVLLQVAEACALNGQELSVAERVGQKARTWRRHSRGLPRARVSVLNAASDVNEASRFSPLTVVNTMPAEPSSAAPVPNTNMPTGLDSPLQWATSVEFFHFRSHLFSANTVGLDDTLIDLFHKRLVRCGRKPSDSI